MGNLDNRKDYQNTSEFRVCADPSNLNPKSNQQTSAKWQANNIQAVFPKQKQFKKQTNKQAKNHSKVQLRNQRGKATFNKERKFYGIQGINNRHTLY